MYDEWKVMMQRVDASLDLNSTEGTIPEKQKNNSKLGQANNGAGYKDYHDRAKNSMTTDDVVPE